ncbi:MAG: hypothetical protein NTY20_06150 [Candidatus Aenigmarchaeota archaeon]|nr:hypothetical protein [Candidatus Aenigmarchaeota archaeon]
MKLLPFTLSSNDIETFKNGAIEFSSSGAGKLTVKVNGAQVFSAIPDPSESIKFDLFNSGINPGNNMITMSVQGDPVQLNNVILKIFLSTDNIIKERTFSFPKDKYDLFVQGYRGRIELEVTRITRQGSMGIRLNDKELNVPAIQKGTNVILFTEKEAVEGTNTLKFSGTGGWDVGEVRILLER